MHTWTLTVLSLPSGFAERRLQCLTVALRRYARQFQCHLCVARICQLSPVHLRILGLCC